MIAKAPSDRLETITISTGFIDNATILFPMQDCRDYYHHRDNDSKIAERMLKLIYCNTELIYSSIRRVTNVT